MSKPIIAIDIDDVLAANAEGFVAFSNERWGTKLLPADYTEHWADVWQVDIGEANQRAMVLHDSGVIGGYRHFDEALPVLTGLCKRYDLIAITSRRISIEKLTREWIDKHYEGIFSDIQFAGIFDGPISLDRLHRTKADLFVSNDVKYVIDDQLKHCLAAAELNINVVLFGEYPWNQIDELPAGVTRCKDWAAVLEYFDGR